MWEAQVSGYQTMLGAVITGEPSFMIETRRQLQSAGRQKIGRDFRARASVESQDHPAPLVAEVSAGEVPHGGGVWAVA